ncbi:MAG: glycosyltransferase family 9 protein [Flavobacteriales bacterium]|nr:glycosyltransferase family 9 protein [Flavobacteriales bacterium]
MKNKILFVCSAGLGDMFIQIPSILAANRMGADVSILAYKKNYARNVFERLSFVNDIIEIRNNIDQIKIPLKFRKFDQVLFNHLFQSPKAIGFISKAAKDLLYTGLQPIKELSNAKWVPPLENSHDILQNLNLVNPDLAFDYKAYLDDFSRYFGVAKKGDYILMQISAGNNVDTYKNWPISNWISFLKMLVPSCVHKIVLIGDENESELGELVVREIPDIQSKIGKTTIDELIDLIGGCHHFIGLDGGPLHIAAAFGKPTFTLWGPSNPALYGYRQFDEKLHYEYKVDLDCQPCNAWIHPNKSRVSDPNSCPDFNCMLKIEPREVFNSYLNFRGGNA